MKKFISILAIVLLVVAVSAPVFAAAISPKGTEGPDIRTVEPKGTEGPDIRVKADLLTAGVQKPKGTEGPDIKRVEPKGTEGPDIRTKG